MVLTTDSLQVLNDKIITIVKAIVPKNDKEKASQDKILKKAMKENEKAKKIEETYQLLITKQSELLKAKIKAEIPTITEAELDNAVEVIFNSYLDAKKENMEVKI